MKNARRATNPKNLCHTMGRALKRLYNRCTPAKTAILLLMICCTQPPAYNQTEVEIGESVKVLEKNEDYWLLEASRCLHHEDGSTTEFIYTIRVPADSTYRFITVADTVGVE